MQRIVVGVDGSPQADRALAWAVREAELRLAAVDVVHCYVVHARGVVMYVPDQDEAESRLDEIIDRNQHVLDRVKWTAGTMGVLNAPSAGLVDAGEDAALIVVGSRGAGGFDRLRLGSTGYRTAAHATTPVAVIPPTAEDDVEDPLGLMVVSPRSRASSTAHARAVREPSEPSTPTTSSPIALTSLHVQLDVHRCKHRHARPGYEGRRFSSVRPLARSQARACDHGVSAGRGAATRRRSWCGARRCRRGWWSDPLRSTTGRCVSWPGTCHGRDRARSGSA